MRVVVRPSHFFGESGEQCLNVEDADMFLAPALLMLRVGVYSI